MASHMKPTRDMLLYWPKPFAWINATTRTHTDANQDNSDIIADGRLSLEDAARDEVLNIFQALVEWLLRKTKVRVTPTIETMSMPSATDVFNLHPRDDVVRRGHCATQVRRIAPNCDPYTGLPAAETLRSLRTPAT